MVPLAQQWWLSISWVNLSELDRIHNKLQSNIYITAVSALVSSEHKSINVWSISSKILSNSFECFPQIVPSSIFNKIVIVKLFNEFTRANQIIHITQVFSADYCSNPWPGNNWHLTWMERGAGCAKNSTFLFPFQVVFPFDLSLPLFKFGQLLSLYVEHWDYTCVLLNLREEGGYWNVISYVVLFVDNNYVIICNKFSVVVVVLGYESCNGSITYPSSFLFLTSTRCWQSTGDV